MFNILKFWTNYIPDGIDVFGNPKMRSIDMVAYAPIGKANMQTCIEAVARLAKVHPLEPNADNQAIVMANMRWKHIKLHYDAWKAGNEIPVTGTPLAAWPGVTSEQVQALKAMGIRTVEEIRDASDGIVARFPFPNARDMQKSAGLFLAAFDKDKISTDMKKLQDEKEVMAAQLEEMRQIVLDMQKEQSAARAKPKDKVAA